MSDKKTGVRKHLTQSEVDQFLTHIQTTGSIRDYAIFLTAYWHGLRVGEVSLLRVTDFRLNPPRLSITRLKNGNSREYLLRPSVAKALSNWIAVRKTTAGPLFPSRRSLFNPSGRGIQPRQLDTLFKKYADSMPAPGLPEDRHHFHVLRHSIAVHMVDANVPIVEIQEWLGHKNIQSTSVYTFVSDKKREEIAGKMMQMQEVGERKEVKSREKRKEVKKSK